MNENDKLEFLNSCGIFLKRQVQITPEKKAQESKQLAVIQKWHSLAQHCIKLWNGYSADYTLRPRDVLDSCCPLCESRLKTVSLKVFDDHVCLADDAVIKVKRIPRNFEGTTDSFLQKSSCVSSKVKLSQQALKIEPVLRLQKNARTLGKLLAVEGPGSMVQLCSRVPTISTKRISTESLTEQVEMLENLVANGYLKVLAKLAREKEEERKQAEKRELFARKSLTINIDRNDLERLQGSPADAIISTPLQTAKLINVLPLSASRVHQNFFQNLSPESSYRKTLWPNRKCFDSPQVGVNNFPETPNSKSSSSDAVAPALQNKVPIQKIDLSNLESHPIQTLNGGTENLATDNNFSATNSESVNSDSNEMESILDEITKDHKQRADKRQLDKSESSEEADTLPAKKTRKTERSVRRPGRPANGVRHEKGETRKVLFAIDATPECINNDRSSLITKYKPCYRKLNGQNVSKSKSAKSTSLPTNVGYGLANNIKGGSRFLAKKLIAESLAGLRSGLDLPPILGSCVRSEKSARQRRHSQPSDGFGAPRPEFRAFIHLKSPAKSFNHVNIGVMQSTAGQGVATMIGSEVTPSLLQQNAIKSSLFISKTSPHNIISCGVQLKRMLADDISGTPGHEIEISDDEVLANDSVPDKETTSTLSSCDSDNVSFKQSVGNFGSNPKSQLDKVRGLLGDREHPFVIDSEDDSGRSTPKAFDEESVSRENITPPNEAHTSPTKSAKTLRASRYSSGKADKTTHRCLNRSNNMQILNFSNSGNKMNDDSENGMAEKIVRLGNNATFDQSYFSLSEDNYSATESDEQLSGSDCTRRSLGRRRGKWKKQFDASSTSGIASERNSKNETEVNHEVKVNGHSHGLVKKVRSSFRERSYSPKSASPRYLASVDKDDCLNMSPVLTKGDPFLTGNSCVATQEVSPQLTGCKNLDTNWNIAASPKTDSTRLRKSCHRTNSKEIQCNSLSQEMSDTDSEVFGNFPKHDFIASPTTLFESI